VTPGPLAVPARRWGPYALAGALLLLDYAWLARGLAHTTDGRVYSTWSLDHQVYSDVIWLGLTHYGHGLQFVHPLPYVHDRIEYPVLLGFTLWLPGLLPGGPASWLAAAGVLTAATTFGSIALVRRPRPGSAWWIAASPALLLDAGINWDLIGIFFLVGAVVWFGEGRYRLSGAATAAGTFFKLFPVVVAPMALAALGSRWWRSPGPHPDGGGAPDIGGGDPPARALARWLVPFTVTSAVIMVPLLVVAPSNTLWFFRFNSQRSEKDSVWVLAGKVLGATVVSNQLINAASLVVVAVALGYGARMVWRAGPADQSRAVALGSALAVMVWMMVNKVWNPQYVLWVFAAGAVVSAPARYGVALGATAVYDWWYEFVVRVPDHSGPNSWLGYLSIIARLAVVGLLVVWTIGQLRSLVAAPARVPEPLVTE
jgi:hypothetical protein